MICVAMNIANELPAQPKCLKDHAHSKYIYLPRPYVELIARRGVCLETVTVALDPKFHVWQSQDKRPGFFGYGYFLSLPISFLRESGI